ncbi:MAG: hypothetical protein U0232_05835 [Thermomicrobiales bacterium]
MAGAWRNRMRLVLEVTEAVRAAWPQELPLGIRLSTGRLGRGGLDAGGFGGPGAGAGQAGDRCDHRLQQRGQHAAADPLGPGYQVFLAEQIRRETGVPTMAVGPEITEPEQARRSVAEGRADLVALARELLRSPYWPLQAARALGVEGSPGRISMRGPSLRRWLGRGSGRR